ncbi:cobaltochelatase subunit CobN, partial [Phascolarctobacterium succinatutens]|uniref:cobaltochelatase subunit CobN n=1 Tax=Phascolarctobacterium succinatutens TaxID=626940 RepID=UPI003FD8C59B
MYGNRWEYKWRRIGLLFLFARRCIHQDGRYGYKEDVINKFVAEEGRYPESVGILLWATYNMRSNGQCMAE